MTVPFQLLVCRASARETTRRKNESIPLKPRTIDPRNKNIVSTMNVRLMYCVACFLRVYLRYLSSNHGCELTRVLDGMGDILIIYSLEFSTYLFQEIYLAFMC